jgi:hypothetical protein
MKSFAKQKRGRTMVDEIREDIEVIKWWLDESNADARRQLAQRNPELWQWLNLVEAKVNERLAQAAGDDKNDV